MCLLSYFYSNMLIPISIEILQDFLKIGIYNFPACPQDVRDREFGEKLASLVGIG